MKKIAIMKKLTVMLLMFLIFLTLPLWATNEIRFPYDSADDPNLYVIIDRTTDANVWDVNNTAWTAWVNVNEPNYALTLSLVKKNDYRASFPTDINTAGIYSITIYLQNGSEPNVTDDLIIGAGDISWDGFAEDNYVLADLRKIDGINLVGATLNLKRLVIANTTDVPAVSINNSGAGISEPTVKITNAGEASGAYGIYVGANRNAVNIESSDYGVLLSGADGSLYIVSGAQGALIAAEIDVLPTKTELDTAQTAIQNDIADANDNITGRLADMKLSTDLIADMNDWLYDLWHDSGGGEFN